MASEEEVSSTGPCKVAIAGRPISPFFRSLRKRNTLHEIEQQEAYAKRLCLALESAPKVAAERLKEQQSTVVSALEFQHYLASEPDASRCPEEAEVRAPSLVGAGSLLSLGLGMFEEKKDSTDTAPSTPKQEEVTKLNLYPSSRFEDLPLRVLENIARRVSAADLCRLSQVHHLPAPSIHSHPSLHPCVPCIVRSFVSVRGLVGLTFMFRLQISSLQRWRHTAFNSLSCRNECCCLGSSIIDRRVLALLTHADE